MLGPKYILGPKLSGLECSGPKCWDPPFWDPNEGTQILGPKCLDVSMVMNVHVFTKSTVGTSRSIISNPLMRVGKSGASISLG